jgi:predicted phosphodiesterase
MKPSRWMVIALVAALLAGCAPPAPPPPTVPPTTATLQPTAVATETVEPPSATVPAPASTPTPTSTPAADLVGITDAPASDTGYTIPLIVRHVGETTATFRFSLAQPETAELILWRSDLAAAPSVTSLGEVTGDQITVEGLQPSTRYQALLLVGEPGRRPTFEGAVWPEVGFHTQGGADRPLRVVAVGDSGFGDDMTRSLVLQMAATAPDLVLHTGDLVYEIERDPDAPTAFIEKLFSPFAPLLTSAPFYPVPGNHDLETAARWGDSYYYFTAFPPLAVNGVDSPEDADGEWYAFSYGDIQFVMLNTQAVFGFGGYQSETDWLAERLADSSFRATIVVLHVPPRNAGRHRTDSSIVRSRWGEMLQAPNVALILAGHDHNYQRFLNDGVTTVVTGGGSETLYTVSGSADGLQAAERRTHFTLLNIGEDEIEIQAIDAAGISFDRATIPLPAR